MNLITNKHWVCRILTQIHDTWYDIINDRYGHNIYTNFYNYINTNKYVIGHDTWYNIIMIDIDYVYTKIK